MKLVIEEFWVDTDGSERPKERVVMKNGGGWTSREEWRKSVKERHAFLRFDERGYAVFAKPTNGSITRQNVGLEG